MVRWDNSMELGFLKTLVIIFGVSALVVFLLQKLKVPSIVGFLIAGTILGPHGFGMKGHPLSDREQRKPYQSLFIVRALKKGKRFVPPVKQKLSF